MTMTEITRLIQGLREIGLTEKAINDFLIYIESGDQTYLPKPDQKSDKDA